MPMCPDHRMEQPCWVCAREKRAADDRNGRVRAEGALIELARAAGLDVRDMIAGSLTASDVAIANAIADIVRER